MNPTDNTDNPELWIERFAELLGCDAQPSAIAVKIQELTHELNNVRLSIPRHRHNAEAKILNMICAKCVQHVRRANRH